jgi:hypothetical protein
MLTFWIPRNGLQKPELSFDTVLPVARGRYLSLLAILLLAASMSVVCGWTCIDVSKTTPLTAMRGSHLRTWTGQALGGEGCGATNATGKPPHKGGCCTLAM